MDEQRDVSITISSDDLKKMFMDKTKIDDNLATLIIGCLHNSSVGIELLAKALLGVFPKIKYKLNDFVFIPVSNLPTWKTDRDATLKLPSCKNECVMGQVISVDPYNSMTYRVKCTVVLTDGHVGFIDALTHDRELQGTPEDPAEILGLIEDMKRELPF